MKPSDALRTRLDALHGATRRFRVANPRVYGSVLHGTDGEGSDLDLLVDPTPETTLFDLGGLQVALEELLGVPVDVRTPGDLPARFRDAVLREARPL
ncbi:nucleotidyltransferase family protein [Luteimonas huabeiensis]|uniref:nucleotidyltransferase family protein n=1 Tax=Luteimonas huabeiensis TaxID=1244513 RepID=UPI00046392F9|nr:nucleotidyltransferase family protein [Luteimonas huabeiensis]